MKKYLTFFLLILMSIGTVAQTTTTELKVGDEGPVNNEWNYCEITGFNGQPKEFDYLVISFDAATKGNQYAICSATERLVTITRSWSSSVRIRTGSVVMLVRLSVR